MEFQPRDRAVYLPAADVLVCADLHVGKDAASNVEFRLGEHEDLIERFVALLGRYEPEQTVIAGDLLDSFSGLPTGVTDTVDALQQAAREADSQLLVTPGNHDTMLEELWNGPTAAEWRLDCGGETVVVTHGHVPPSSPEETDWYVVGHDHPTIEIEGVRRPCYLFDDDHYEGAGVLMLPSFSRLPAGVVVNGMSAADFQSPLIVDADALTPIVREEGCDETHRFPSLGEFRRLL